MRLSATTSALRETCLAPGRLFKALPAAALLGACGGAPAPREPDPISLSAGSVSVDTLTLRAVAAFLSHDELRGRGTGSEGARIAASYLAAECRRLGVQPMGHSGFFQELPLTQATVVPEGTSIRITGPGVDTTFTYYEDFIPDVGTARTLGDFSGDLVYAGRAQDILFRRSDLPPLEGKVALLRGEFGGHGAAADTLYARGAVGVIQVVDDARRYRLYRQTRGPARLHLDDPDVRPSYVPPLPAVLAGPRMTVTLYLPLTGVGSGSWNDAYLNGLAAGLPPPQDLAGWRADVRVHTSPARVRASNVGCVLPGRNGIAAGRPILLTAHYDHLGVGAPDSQGDSIYNGFADNAAGVAMVLGVGEAFARERRAGGGLDHPLVLLFFAGEEHGLLGSDYFVTHPAWPLDRLAGVVNLDGNAPAARPQAWRVAGDEGDPLVAAVRAEIAREGWSMTLAPPSPGSDYYPFVRRGVPAVFFVPGEGPFEGLSLTASDSLRAVLWGRYHQPDDEYDESFPFEGLARYAELAAAVVRRLDREDGAAVAVTAGWSRP